MRSRRPRRQAPPASRPVRRVPRPSRGPSDAWTIAALKRAPYFRTLPVAELERLARHCHLRVLRKGEHAFEAGDACPGLLVIAEGAVEMRQISPRGREQVLHAEGVGATLGEAPLFDGQGYIASAVAIAPTRLLLLPRDSVLDLCRRRPDVSLAMLEAMARRVRRFAALAEDLAFRQVIERLARHIEAGASVAGQPPALGAVVDLALTHEQLAARLGTVRELVSRAFRQLDRSGAVRRSRSRVTIRDPERLAGIARAGAP
jgi:CRP/FNR family transcriptional regulator, dissimilatory nitrate respiration regulator